MERKEGDEGEEEEEGESEQQPGQFRLGRAQLVMKGCKVDPLIGFGVLTLLSFISHLQKSQIEWLLLG